MRVQSTLALAVLMLSGCAWPEPGRGGMDEARLDRRMTRAAADQPMAASYRRLARKLDRARLEIDRLTAGAGRKYRPALLTGAEIQWGRSARALEAGFHADAAGDLSRLEKTLARINKELAARTVVGREQ